LSTLSPIASLQSSSTSSLVAPSPLSSSSSTLLPQAPTTVGTAISRSWYARCACPCIDPFLTCLGRYLVNGSNRFVRRLRVIADVTLV
jgi:hypothetical protein